MVDQTVKIVDHDGKYRVAYDMALLLWSGAHNGEYPTADDEEEFLNLVSRCIQSLNNSAARRL